MPAATRRFRWLAAGALALVALLGVSYAPISELRREYLVACPGSGASPGLPGGAAEGTADDYGLGELRDLETFYAALDERAGDLTRLSIGSVSHGGRDWPIYLIGKGPVLPAGAALVVAGLHGDESSSSLAALEILDAMDDGALEGAPLVMLAPASPVGLARGSRYNAAGCNVNRDFEAFATVEAKAIRSAIDAIRPRLVIALHENTRDGALVVGTQITSDGLLAAIVERLGRDDVPLAARGPVGIPLSRPGVLHEGPWLTRVGRWLELHDIGYYATSVDVPFVTTAVPSSWAEVDQRVDAQVMAVRAAVRAGVPGGG